MKALTDKIEWIVAIIVVVVCGVFIFLDLSATESDALGSLRNDDKLIKEALNSNQVDASWEWAPANQPKFAENFQASMRRPAEPLTPVPDGWIFNARPQRPNVAADQKPDLEGKIVKTSAGLDAPTDVSAKSDHGSVYLAFKLPTGNGLRFFHVVRVEVYRGLKEDEVKDLIGTVEIGTEEAAEGEVIEQPSEKKVEAHAAPKAEDLNTTARSNKPDEQPAKPTDSPAAQEDTPIPPEYKSLIVFRDQDVQPKKTYFYRLRLVGRLVKLGAGDLVAGPDKKTVYKVEVPATLAQVKPIKAENPARLYGSAMSAAASDTAPPNFQLRFAGVIGELPKEGQVLPPGFVPSYQGNFVVQVWVPALRDWKEDVVRVGVNQEITGTIKYKSAESADRESFEYKTGLKLVEIQNKAERKMETRMVPVTAKKTQADGTEVEEPVMDEKTGRPKMAETQIERTIPNQVAILLDTDTKKNEEFYKRADFEKRKKAFEILDRIYKDQEVQAKKEADRVKKLLAQQKALMEKKKMEEQQRMNPPAGVPGEGPGGPMMPPNGPPGTEGPGGMR